ncbi:hypothetical protein H8E65_05695 [Candidatus Bathyarchaeota archaeon]|nr:hypothetical protein [Candidatus Bathyarchaeota archaeon]MBL7079911.1 hypothetical protein [Candidatus Bathyarchaeota archaeon]
MYVIGRVEVEETVSILSLEEPEVSFSLEEFERYADLFEEMLERMEREDAEGEENETYRNKDELGWSYQLDEFDLAEIEGMRERYSLIREA